MSRFKKIFGLQYEFSSQSSSQSSPQERKVRYVKEKSKTDGNNTEIENLSIEENQEWDETTQSCKISRSKCKFFIKKEYFFCLKPLFYSQS